MAKKFLDETGLTKVWAKIKSLFATKTEANQVQTNLTNFMNTKSKANGLCPLDSSSKVPSQYLPSYVDDVVEYPSKSTLPETGETGKIYVARNTNLTYRWTGTDYVEISPSLALGETSSTAYAGDKGKLLYDVVSPTEIRDDLGGTVYSNLISLNDHVIDEENPHNVTKAQLGLGNVDNTSDSAKPVSTAQQAALDEKVDKSVTASGGMGVSGIVNSGSSMEFSVKNNSSDTDATRLYLTKMQVTLDVSGVQALSAMAKSGVVTLNGPGGNILDESMVLTDTDIEDICV